MNLESAGWAKPERNHNEADRHIVIFDELLHRKLLFRVKLKNFIMLEYEFTRNLPIYVYALASLNLSCMTLLWENKFENYEGFSKCLNR